MSATDSICGVKGGACHSPPLFLPKSGKDQDGLTCGPQAVSAVHMPPSTVTRGVAHQTRAFDFADHLSDAERRDWVIARALDRARGLG